MLFRSLLSRSDARLAAHLAKKNASEDRTHVPTSDKDEELCRKALAVFNGTDGGASLREVVLNLWQLTQSECGVVLGGEGTFSQEYALTLSAEERHDLTGQKRKKVAATVELHAEVDVPVAVYEQQGEKVIQALVEKLQQVSDYVMARILPALKVYADRKGVVTVSGEPNKFNTDKVEALAVDTETEKAHQLRHQRRMDDLIDKKYLAATTQDSEDSASRSPSVDESEARAASESEEAGRS